MTTRTDSHEDQCSQGGWQRAASRIRPAHLVVPLIVICIADLPFTYAMTLDVGVPIKIYDIALCAIAFLLLGETCLLGRLPFCMEQDDRRVVAILGVFCLSYSVSYLFGLERIAEHAGSLPEWFSGRYNPSLASSLRVVQIIGNSLFFLLILSYGRRREPLFIKAWLVGACLSAFYSWYLIGCTLTGREPIMLPGMEGGLSDSLIIGVLGRTVPRSGTFLEGNFAGPFMLLSALLALSLHSMHKRWYTLWAAWFLWATVFLTFSTIPIICALAVPVVVIAMRLREAKPIEKRMLLGYVAVVTLAFGCTQVFSIPIIKEVVAYKVFGSPDDNTAIALSMADRKDFAQAGLKIAREFPTLGVGPSNYGLYFEKYSQVRGLGFGKKLIANNVYVELLAESGVLGFIAFFGFTYVVVRRYLWRAKWGKVQRLTALGFASLLLMFNAFPTFAVAYVWVYLAFVYLFAFSAEMGNPGTGTRRRSIA